MILCAISYSNCNCIVLTRAPTFTGTTLMMLSSCVHTRRNSICKLSTSGWLTLSSAGSFRKYVSAVSAIIEATQPPSSARSNQQIVAECRCIKSKPLHTWSNGPVFVPASSKSVAGELTQTYLFLENAGRHDIKEAEEQSKDERTVCDEILSLAHDNDLWVRS